MSMKMGCSCELRGADRAMVVLRNARFVALVRAHSGDVAVLRKLYQLAINGFERGGIHESWTRTRQLLASRHRGLRADREK